MTQASTAHRSEPLTCQLEPLHRWLMKGMMGVFALVSVYLVVSVAIQQPGPNAWSALLFPLILGWLGYNFLYRMAVSIDVDADGWVTFRSELRVIARCNISQVVMPRRRSPQWARHTVVFRTPQSEVEMLRPVRNLEPFQDLISDVREGVS
jgi:hypothetical protein